MLRGAERSVEGEEKSGKRELLQVLAADAPPLAFSSTRFSSLVLTLETPLGNYRPCRVPVHRLLAYAQPAAEQSDSVNFVVEAEAELEA